MSCLSWTYPTCPGTPDLQDRRREQRDELISYRSPPFAVHSKSGGPGETTEWMDPRFRGLRNSRVFILVFDICSPESFHHVKHLRQQILDSTSKAPVIVVVGNKRDQQKLRFAPRHVLSLLVKKNWKCGYLECSARNNWHILLLFKELLISTTARSRSKTPSICLQGALHRERCSVM
ncbi:ras-like protein family member 10A isoform X2 [Pyxicephalus adspersus]|uniref:ras-like protein family member 10A isoform X2 n=1 Tax=Pyxicephalus adspersus TaxID=30357 RepID=UPI003B5B586F